MQLQPFNFKNYWHYRAHAACYLIDIMLIQYIVKEGVQKEERAEIYINLWGNIAGQLHIHVSQR